MVITREYEQRQFGDLSGGSVFSNGHDYYIVTDRKDALRGVGTAVRLEDGMTVEFPRHKLVYVLNRDQYTFTVRA
jgi:hypothetical protein